MKKYDKIILKEDIGGYKKGTKGIIVELFDNSFAYIEVLDENEDTIGMLYDVPVSQIKTDKNKDTAI